MRSSPAWRFLRLLVCGLPLAGLAQTAAGPLPGLPPPPSAASGLSLSSLEQIDVRTFAQLISDVSGRRFVVADDVQAKFSVVLPGRELSRLPPGEVYTFFLSVLAAANLTVAEDRDVGRIVKLPEGTLALGAGAADTTFSGGLLTRVFRLEHVSAEEARRLLESNGARKTGIGVLEESNQLVVTDTAPTLDRVARLLQEVDQPGLARLTEVVPLQFADAEQLAQQLNAALAESESRASQLLSRLPAAPGGGSAAAAFRAGSVVPAPHANSVILVGPQRQVENLRLLVARLDVETPTGRGRLNAIFLHYLKAEEAAKSITSLMEKSAAKSADSKSVRRIAVEASAANNALLVDASPSDFEVVRKLAEQLDCVPEQVHISVLIAEVGDGNALTLGTELTALSVPGSEGDIAVSGASRFSADQTAGVLDSIQNGLFPQGISVGVAKAVGVDGSGNLIVGYPGIINVTALRQNEQVEILSETTLQAQDNQEATVSIVNDIPILKSTIQGGSGTSRDVIQNIERQEVGVKLTLVPHVVPGGQVRMELNPSIEAVLDTGGEDGLTPTIARRSAKTTVTVPDGQTIVIAGLTRKDRQRLDRRIPLLGDIPVLGWLFRYKSEVEKRTNLLILVTPTLVASPADAARVTQAWREKTGIGRDEPQPPPSK